MTPTTFLVVAYMSAFGDLSIERHVVPEGRAQCLRMAKLQYERVRVGTTRVWCATVPFDKPLPEKLQCDSPPTTSRSSKL